MTLIPPILTSSAVYLIFQGESGPLHFMEVRRKDLPSFELNFILSQGWRSIHCFTEREAALSFIRSAEADGIGMTNTRRRATSRMPLAPNVSA
jgi:hypothetical protein